MFRYRPWLIVVAAGLWLVGSIGISHAQKAGDDKARAQGIESVKKNLQRDPKNQGLQHALTCLERADQCNDPRKLDQAIGSVKDNLKSHPDDQGMHHALNDLQHHHDALQHHSMEHGQTGRDHPMPRDSMPHKDAPHSSGTTGGTHR